MGQPFTSPNAGAPARSALVFDRASIQAVDRAAVEEFGIPGMVLMENAALGLARHAATMLKAAERPDGSVLICCGAGNNGGDGYALARHLHNRGARPVLAALGTPRPGTDAAINQVICQRMGLPQTDGPPWDDLQCDLIVDGLFGTGLDRPVRGAALEWIGRMNRSGRPILAIDVPSGLDCQTGQPLGEAVRADCTVTFVGLKQGFLDPAAHAFLGRTEVVDIGAPRQLYERLGRPVA
jgi:NAD(P)H-hydrate epimerase